MNRQDINTAVVPNRQISVLTLISAHVMRLSEPWRMPGVVNRTAICIHFTRRSPETAALAKCRVQVHGQEPSPPSRCEHLFQWCVLLVCRLDDQISRYFLVISNFKSQRPVFEP